jgi:hypothetical protein
MISACYPLSNLRRRDVVVVVVVVVVHDDAEIQFGSALACSLVLA